MTGRPPRASTKGEGRTEGKRAKTRGSTHSDRDRDKRRSASVVPTDRYERIDDDEILEVADVPAEAGPPRLRMLVLEVAPHLPPAQGAIVAAGHSVVIGAAGREGIDKLRFAVGEVDAMLVGMPGGELLIDAAYALGPRRPVVIAAWTASAIEAARRAAAAGADLATVRPHNLERLAPILLAASRLVEQRRATAQGGHPVERSSTTDIYAGVPPEADHDPEPVGFLAAEPFAQAALRELERARRYGYPLAVAMFMLEVSQPPPAPGLRGILRARAGNALVHALRDIDLATELDQDRFLVVMPHTDRAGGAEVARRIIGAVAAGDPVTAAGRTFPPRVIGAVTAAPPGEVPELPSLVRDATQLLESAQASGASLAVES
ncbi:MAG: diguanylate cyclase [Deltaproteobacteria bacterium]|nr:MAG: diguanylate cyclase [Deltaproteobacteria bacterium]TMQ27376.1 MAG: diguanylate cyclase [Deltaproteobacteria bacterium]